MECIYSCSDTIFLFTITALQLPAWLPKQRPRVHSVSKYHGILVIVPAELPVFPSDTPLLGAVESPPDPLSHLTLHPPLWNQQRMQLLIFNRHPAAFLASVGPLILGDVIPIWPSSVRSCSHLSSYCLKHEGKHKWEPKKKRQVLPCGVKLKETKCKREVKASCKLRIMALINATFLSRTTCSCVRICILYSTFFYLILFFCSLARLLDFRSLP